MKHLREPKEKDEWAAYYDLRYRILRQPWNQPRSSAFTPEDDTAKHFALYENTMLVAIARLDELDKTSAQVRFFAVDETYQGKGYGKTLIQGIEDYCSQNQITRLILEARENAIPFYASQGYTITKEGKLLFDKIRHSWMIKNL